MTRSILFPLHNDLNNAIRPVPRRPVPRRHEVPGVVDWSLPIVLLKCSETLAVKATLQSEGK